ncbi:MAG: Gmad2 immunoglobulin-like domain-containing protein [Nocardioidaceae bacterium]
MSADNDEELRALLEHAVSDVEPRHSLDEIRARTAHPTGSRRPWLWGVGGAIVATAATVTAVALLGNAPGTTPQAGPASHGSTSPKPSAFGGPGVGTFAVYYVGATRHGPRLFREFDRFALSAPPAVPMVTQTLIGKAHDPDYGSLWPAATKAVRIALAGSGPKRIIQVVLASPVDLARRPRGMSASEARLALQQVVYTVQADLQDTAPVEFLRAGGDSEGPTALTHVLGVPARPSVGRAPALSTLAQIWIDNPTNGATVPTTFKVTGLAATFEGNVVWELTQDGNVVKHGFTTARQCCTLSPYSFTVRKVPVGSYTLVVHDTDESGNGGPPPWEDTRQIIVGQD